CKLDGRKLRGLSPAFHRYSPILGIDARGDFAWEPRAGFADQRRVADGSRTEDHAGDAAVQPMRDRAQRPDAAAELNGDLDGCKNGRSRLGIDGAAFKGAVEIDDVQCGETLAYELTGLTGRVYVEDGCLFHEPLAQAHTLPVF